jgi:hypothetical protein
MGHHAFKPVKLGSINNPTVSVRAISCVPDDWLEAQSRTLLLFKKGERVFFEGIGCGMLEAQTLVKQGNRPI